MSLGTGKNEFLKLFGVPEEFYFKKQSAHLLQLSEENITIMAKSNKMVQSSQNL